MAIPIIATRDGGLHLDIQDRHDHRLATLIMRSASVQWKCNDMLLTNILFLCCACKLFLCQVLLSCYHNFVRLATIHSLKL